MNHMGSKISKRCVKTKHLFYKCLSQFLNQLVSIYFFKAFKNWSAYRQYLNSLEREFLKTVSRMNSFREKGGRPKWEMLK